MMTTLQIVLAIVGVVLIGAIVVYNLVQERRFRREAERMFSHRREDIMLGESVRSEAAGDEPQVRVSFGAKEPVAPEVAHALEEVDKDFAPMSLEREPRHADASPSQQPASVKSVQAEEAQAPDAPAQAADLPPEPFPPVPRAPQPKPGSQAAPVLRPPPAEPRTESMAAAGRPQAPSQESGNTERGVPKHATSTSHLDPDTEYVARIRFATPSAANFAPLLTTLRRIGKPVRAFGLRLDGVWEPLTGHPRASYDLVEIGLQLADRNGAVSHDQLDAFCRALYGFAAEEGGAVSCPDKQHALQVAKSLDMLCMEVDVLIGLNIIASDSRPFTSEAIHKEATVAQMTLEADGAYHARDAFGHTLFTLTNQDDQPFPRDGRGLTVHGLTLLFDVPRVADGLAVFDRMTRLGFDLAWRLEGRLVDDNGRAVTEDNLNRDRARLAAFYGRMEARGIPAGGERALRLFV
jgi:FtsZ-interacting cell division protein ZipA